LSRTGADQSAAVRNDRGWSKRGSNAKVLGAALEKIDGPVLLLRAERELAVLSWGFVLLQAGKAPRRVTNVRDDKVLTSSFWRPSFEERRCLVPASSYCEPKGEKPATWHWFSINGDEPRPMFAFPGVWTRYKGPLKKNGETVEQEVFAFMTTEPNALTASINHERMPVLLSNPDDFETWLSAPPEEAFKLARSYAAEQMRIVQSGSERKDMLAA
jgi:putative SOS response-associated peptidase YedK